MVEVKITYISRTKAQTLEYMKFNMNTRVHAAPKIEVEVTDRFIKIGEYYFFKICHTQYNNIHGDIKAFNIDPDKCTFLIANTNRSIGTKFFINKKLEKFAKPSEFTHSEYLTSENTRILCNSMPEMEFYSKHGYKGHLINELIYLNDDLYDIDNNVQKDIDVLYLGRTYKIVDFIKEYPFEFKIKTNWMGFNDGGAKMYKNLPKELIRHTVNYYNEDTQTNKFWDFLDKNNGDFPSPYGQSYKNSEAKLWQPFFNKDNDNDKETLKYINRSRLGCITSPTEGTPRTVGEFLLSGVPMVSTRIIQDDTLGGRELFLDQTNSIYCNRDKESFQASCEYMLKNIYQYDPISIRREFLKILNHHRTNLLFVMKNLIEENANVDFFYLLEMIKYHTKSDDMIAPLFNIFWPRWSVETKEWKKTSDHFKSKYR